MTYIPEKVRKRIRQRAGNRCEYCLSHQQFIMAKLQIDHIIPVSEGGKNTENNLCLSCDLCNQFKWTRTKGIDLESGEVVALFNPRKDKWNAHFTWSKNGIEIIGLTPCGRATVQVLKLNNQLAKIVRKNWVKAGWHPPEI